VKDRQSELTEYYREWLRGKDTLHTLTDKQEAKLCEIEQFLADKGEEAAKEERWLANIEREGREHQEAMRRRREAADRDREAGIRAIEVSREIADMLGVHPHFRVGSYCRERGIYHDLTDPDGSLSAAKKAAEAVPA
jgi:hypothetical protein